MALVILDESNVGVTPTPDGGFAIKLSEIGGFPGIDLMVPFGPKTAEEIYDHISRALGHTKTVAVADVPTMKKEAVRHRTTRPTT